jgi:hypothetical protein
MPLLARPSAVQRTFTALSTVAQSAAGEHGVPVMVTAEEPQMIIVGCRPPREVFAAAIERPSTRVAPALSCYGTGRPT